DLRDPPSPERCSFGSREEPTRPLVEKWRQHCESRVDGRFIVHIRPTVSPLLTPVSSRNALFLQSLPTNTPFWQVNSRRRKDDTRVGTAARGIVERLSRLPRRFPGDGGASGRVRHALSTGARDRGRPARHAPLPPGAPVAFATQECRGNRVLGRCRATGPARL